MHLKHQFQLPCTSLTYWKEILKSWELQSQNLQKKKEFELKKQRQSKTLLDRLNLCMILVIETGRSNLRYFTDSELMLILPIPILPEAKSLIHE